MGIDPKAYWIGFNLVKGIGAVRLRTLIEYFGDLEAAWKAPFDRLRAAGMSPRILDNLLQVRKGCSLEQLWENVQRKGVTVLTWEDEDYPRRLLQIDQPPPVLFVRGEIRPEDELAVAVVGTRRMTGYGHQVTDELAAFLARNGLTVVSGLARGVDRTAHESSLKANGRTIAVLGSGVDRIYPPEHSNLADRIAGQGAVISDYALGAAPEATNFPPRNRIISGLSLATVVVEAGDTSGALITATFAAEQGRDVFAVPGSIFAPNSRGTNRLISQGARPLLKFEDVLEELSLGLVQEKRAARTLIPGDNLEARLLPILNDSPIHVDEICAQSGLPIDQVSATLTIMELKGMVRQSGGMNFALIREDQADYRTESDA
jgi:DNA processing protein